MQVFESLCQMYVIHVNICYHYLFWLWAVIKAYIICFVLPEIGICINMYKSLLVYNSYSLAFANTIFWPSPPRKNIQNLKKSNSSMYNVHPHLLRRICIDRNKKIQRNPDMSFYYASTKPMRTIEE